MRYTGFSQIRGAECDVLEPRSWWQTGQWFRREKNEDKNSHVSIWNLTVFPGFSSRKSVRKISWFPNGRKGKSLYKLLLKIDWEYTSIWQVLGEAPFRDEKCFRGWTDINQLLCAETSCRLLQDIVRDASYYQSQFPVFWARNSTLRRKKIYVKWLQRLDWH